MNNFKDYGFEADFEGHIYERDRTYLLGKVRLDCDIKLFRWNYQTGICREDEKYNLKPIKKEWYENADNFPCLVVNNNKKILYVNKYQYTKEINTHWAIYQERGENIYSLNLEYHRPATKEEVLSLLVKE